MMDRKSLKIIFILIFAICLFAPDCYSGEDKDLYNRGIRAARRGDADEAFSYFHMVLYNSYKTDRLTENSLFAVGEYYFLIGARHDIKMTFRKVADDYPESITGLLALGFLFNVAREGQGQDQMESLKKEIVGFKQVSLLFRDSEEFKYLSAMQKNYRVLYFIDKVEIYIDGELFEEIPF